MKKLLIIEINDNNVEIKLFSNSESKFYLTKKLEYSFESKMTSDFFDDR